MHLVHPPSNHTREPEEGSAGQRNCPDCSGSPWDATRVCVCVLSVLIKSVAQQWPCTREAQQAHHAAEGAAHGKQAASLTFPGSCWADRAFLELQFYAYISKPHIQCIECLFMLNK